MRWPYDDDEGTSPGPDTPSWACPEDLCTCHPPTGKEDPVEFSVMLLSSTGERMPGAICRVTYQGQVINEPQPNADGSGWITAKVPRTPSTVLVEWAPADAPKTPGYPFRRRYYVTLAAQQEPPKRRLQNLGYVRAFTLVDNVRDFQRAYGYEQQTGNLDDIKDDLVVYHDEGRAPLIDKAQDNGGGGGGSEPVQGPVMKIPLVQAKPGGKSSLVQGASQTDNLVGADGAPPQGGGGGDGDEQPKKADPQAPPPAPPARGNPSIGKGVAQVTRKLPSILKAIADIGKNPKDPKDNDANGDPAAPALFELVLVFADWTDPKDSTRNMWGFFWVFADALMWEVPTDATWGSWAGTTVEQQLPRKPYRGVTIGDRKRLLRLPCSAQEAQSAVDLLSFSQAELLAFDGGSDLNTTSSPDKVPCVMPTAELYALAYLQADVRIKPQALGTTGSLVPDTLLYNERMAKELDTQAKANTSLTRPFKSMADPGKIWVLAERMDTWNWCEGFCQWAFAAINYGWHDGITWDSAGKARVAKTAQSPGGCHPWSHIDYSQIFWPVAGWCLVKSVDETDATWKRTEAVYTDTNKTEMWRLVRTSGPVPAMRYRGQRPSDGPQPARPTNLSAKCKKKLGVP
jgi:hypothetical protein